MPQLHGTLLASPCCTLRALGGHLPGGVTAAYTLCWVLSAQSPEASALSSWKSLVLPGRQQASLGSGTFACASCCPLSSSPTHASLQSLLSKPLPTAANVAAQVWEGGSYLGGSGWSLCDH